MKCTKCNGEMIKGHLDLTMGINWKEDRKGIIGNLNKVFSNIKMHKCNKCGYLESYVK